LWNWKIIFTVFQNGVDFQNGRKNGFSTRTPRVLNYFCVLLFSSLHTKYNLFEFLTWTRNVKNLTSPRATWKYKFLKQICFFTGQSMTFQRQQHISPGNRKFQSSQLVRCHVLIFLISSFSVRISISISKMVYWYMACISDTFYRRFFSSESRWRLVQDGSQK
jgi:hypothetical protein